MKLLLDENLSWRILQSIDDLFPGSQHVTRAGLHAGTSDRQVWDYARLHGFTILTADHDFRGLARELGPPPKVVLLEGCDYPTAIAAQVIRANAVRIAEYETDGRPVLVLRNPNKS